MCHEKPEPTLTAAEQLFFDPMPGMLPVYRTLRAKLFAAHPDMTVRTAKTQISFYNRRLFACVSLPRKKLLGTLDAALLVTIGLGARRASPRVVCAVEPYPGRWTHHVLVADADDLDDELLCWLDEAYAFSMAK